MKIKTVHTHEYISLINYLITLRKESNISQIDMAITLNLKQSDISKIEIKERRIDICETFLWLNKCSPKNNEVLLTAYNIFFEIKLNENN